MSYSTREMGVPSMLATGAGAGGAAFSGAAGAWPLPQAVTRTANAIRMAMRVHGVLKNWLIWSSTQKKSDYGHIGQRARGRQFSLNRPISPIFDAVTPCKEGCCCKAAWHDVAFSPAAMLLWRAHECRFS